MRYVALLRHWKSLLSTVLLSLLLLSAGHAPAVAQNLIDWGRNAYGQLGRGTLTPSSAPLVWRVVGTPDLDGDGHPDLLWHNQQTGQLVCWLLDGVKVKTNGMGNLTPSVMSPIWALAPGS
jgi:hypothetical protein